MVINFVVNWWWVFPNESMVVIGDFQGANKNLKAVCCFSRCEGPFRRTSEPSESFTGESESGEPAPGKAWILPFWCLKKTSLKGCGSEN